MHRISKFIAILITVLLSVYNSAKGADPLIFQSTEERSQLLELFTSQGCSSCPPAERWINQFADYPGLWSEIVPVVYHVDYWDYLGWKDPFASKAFTQRQHAYAEERLIRQVYTPCFVSNGEEWRGYFSKDLLPKSKEIAGILQARAENGRLKVSYSEEQPLTLNVAILGLNVVTDVKSGENRGRKLEQQFVVLDHQSSFSKDGKWTLELPSIELSKAERFGIAIWVSKRGDFEPLQVTASWIDSHHFN